MSIKPYHAWLFLGTLLLVSAQRFHERAWPEVVEIRKRAPAWLALVRETTEQLDRDKAHRYADLAPDLRGTRDVGYFQEVDRSTLWPGDSPEGHDRISRYYMAQGILAPAVLRRDELWPRVVVDCATAEQARQVLARLRLNAIHDYGRGLVLARAGD